MKQNRIVLALALAGVMGTGAQASAQANANGSQSKGAVAIEAVGGYAGFLDESMINRAVAGAAGRVCAGGPVWVGAELLYLSGSGEEHDWLVMPFVTLDLGSGGVVPYLVVGTGWLRSTTLVGTGPYTSTSWSVGGGGGVRVRIGSRAYVAAEGRLGTKPLTRATVAVGWRLR